MIFKGHEDTPGRMFRRDTDVLLITVPPNRRKLVVGKTSPGRP